MIMDGERDSADFSQYSEQYSNDEEEYDQAVDFGPAKVPRMHLNLDEKIASSTRTSRRFVDSLHSSAFSGHYSNTVEIGTRGRPDGETSATESPRSDDSPSGIDATCHDLETILRTGQNLLNTNANTNCTPSQSGGGYRNDNRRCQRSLSQTSIVSLSKLQTICEKNESMDDTKGIDLEQTVKSCGTEDEREGSVVSDLGESESEWEDDVAAGQGVEDGDGEQDESLVRRSDKESSCDNKNDVKGHILPLVIFEVSDDHQQQNTTSKQQPPRRGSFLPQDCTLPLLPLQQQHGDGEQCGSLDRGNEDENEITFDNRKAVEVRTLPFDTSEVSDYCQQQNTTSGTAALFAPTTSRKSEAMHYACIIGVNHEWPEQRKTRGDIGLARCLSRHCKLPRERLVEVYDERATRSNVLHSLEQLLNRRNEKVTEDDVLLLYYGGHGKRAEACTFTKSAVNGNMQHEPWLRYDEIVDLLERKFRGGTAWVIVDCCHSGSFGEAVMKRYRRSNKLNVSYGCVMSVPPWDIAGMEWSVTECFIRAFKGELLSCSGSSLVPHYLSTKKGKHRIETLDADGIEFANNSASDVSKSQPGLHPSWEQVIEFLADEMARIKGDQLTTLFCGKGMSDGEYLKRHCVFGEQFTSTDSRHPTRLESCISRDKSWMNTFVQNEYTINDEVYVKWSGSISSAKDSSNSFGYTIGWLPGRIVSTENDIACINIRDVITETSWTVEVTIGNQAESNSRILMGGLPFSFHLDPRQCATAVTHLAKQLCYLDTSLHPYTRLQILWNDGKFYPGMVMCPNEVVWELVNAHEVDDDYCGKGPYLPVKWVEEDTISLVPRGKCVLASQVPNEKELATGQRAAEKAAYEASKSIQTPMDAMLASLSSSGKTLRPTNVPILTAIDVQEQDNYDWEAYDAEDKDFLPVQIMNHITKVPLKVLAYHMCFRQSGYYSVVFWEEDSVLSLVPSNFLRLRSSDDDSSSSSGGDDENSESTTEDPSLLVDKMTHIHSKSPVDAAWQTIDKVHLGLLSVSFVTFGIGFLLGKRAKAS